MENNFSQGVVWPPPPMVSTPMAGQGAQPYEWSLPHCRFKFLQRRAPGKIGEKALISDFREGTLFFDNEGMIIQALAVPPLQTRNMILGLSCLAGGIGVVIASSLIESTMRSQVRSGIRWSDITQVVVDPEKNQACLVYNAPLPAGKNKPPKIKPHSLAFMMTPGYETALTQAVGHFLPERTGTGKLRGLYTWKFWVILLCIFLGGAGLVIALTMSGN